MMNSKREREITEAEAVRITQSISYGDAPLEVAYEWAFKMLAYSTEKFAHSGYETANEITADEARVKLDELEAARHYVRFCEQLFARYPVITVAFKNQAVALLFAQTFLTPIFMLANKSVIERTVVSTKTYIIKNSITGHYKIGRAQDITARMKSLQCGSSSPLVLMAMFEDDRERDLHRQFKKYRRQGEWFDDSDGKIDEYFRQAIRMGAA